MRIFVPILTVFAVFAGVSARAQTPIEYWAGFQTKYNCASEDQVSKMICTEAYPLFCAGRAVVPTSLVIQQGQVQAAAPPPAPGSADSNCRLSSISPDRPLNKVGFEQIAGAAVQACMALRADASLCCGNAAACPVQGAVTPGSSETSINAYCERLQRDTAWGLRVNSKVAGTCLAKKEICVYRCTTMYNHLKSFEFMSPGSQSFKNLGEIVSECSGMDGTIAERQAREMSNSSTASGICAASSQDGTTDPASADTGGGGTTSGGSSSTANEDVAPASSSGPTLGGIASKLAQYAGPIMQMLAARGQQQPVPENLDYVDCSVNPMLAGCSPQGPQAAKPAGNGDPMQVAGVSAEPEGAGGFNPASADGAYDQPGVGGGAPGTPATSTAVPNGGGGGIPGGGGGGAASLGGGGGGSASNASASGRADVLHGEKSGGGGFSSMNASMNMKAGGDGGGGYNYAGLGGLEENLNLGDFLPGGARDPLGRGVAGAISPSRREIQSKEVNIWNRISDHIRSRCSQGLLRDCVP